MRQAANLLAADLSLGELFERLTTMIAQYVDSTVVFVALVRPDGRNAIEYFYDHGEIRRYPHIELTAGSRAREVIRTGEISWGGDPSVWAPHGSMPIHRDRPWTNDTVSAIFVPMRAAGSTVGCLSVQSKRADAYTDEHVDAIAAIGHFLGVAVLNQRMYQTVQRTAEYDALTGLCNQAKLSRELESWILSNVDDGVVMTAMFDVLNFQRFNDTYGYAEGDDVLRRIAAVLREFEDDVTLVGRSSGDVFSAIVREASLEGARRVVGRMFNRLRQIAYVARSQTVPISVACGYAIAPLDGGTRAELVARCVNRTRMSRMYGCIPIGADTVEEEPLHGSFEGVDGIVSSLLERDPYMRAHLRQVNELAKAWTPYNLDFNRDESEAFLRASLLHDVGKLLVADRILMKPGRLTAEEYRLVQEHPTYGRDILANQPGFETVAEAIGQHHEHWDGSGYPQGLRAEAIHPIARAVSVLDAYSAMVADRAYHRGVTEDAALAELQRCSGTQFDPFFVERFVAWREECASVSA